MPFQEAEDVITDLQKELFKAQGIDGGWGIECLGQVGDTYQDDTNFMKLFVTAVERCFHHIPWAAVLHACISGFWARNRVLPKSQHLSKQCTVNAPSQTLSVATNVSCCWQRRRSSE